MKSLDKFNKKLIAEKIYSEWIFTTVCLTTLCSAFESSPVWIAILMGMQSRQINGILDVRIQLLICQSI